MSVKQKECWKCKERVYTIEGKFAGKMVSGQFQAFTNRDGTPKLQEYNDMSGEIAHYITCSVRKQAQQFGGQGGQQQQQQFQNKEQSNTYIPPGYIQTPQQIPIPQSTPEPAILTQILTTLEAMQTMLGIMKK